MYSPDAANMMAMETVGIFHKADSASLHTSSTTTAVEIQSATNSPLDAYLDVDQLVSVARFHANTICNMPL